MNKPAVKIGDIFESGAQTLVNTVNCVGVMGKGIALEFRKRFPDMHKDYVQRCEAGRVQLGRPYLYKSLVGPWILNFPTKGHWRAVSRLSDIIRGLEYLERHYKEWGIKELAVPPLGCGSGQLDWTVVGPTLYRNLSRLDIPVTLFAPTDTPAQHLAPEFLERPVELSEQSSQQHSPFKVDPAGVALVTIVNRIRNEPYHWPIGRIAFQKIAYFATECGIPTGLTYRRSSYGPFADTLKPLVAKLVNNGLLTETRSGNMFLMAAGPTYRDAHELHEHRLRQWESAIERVADLFLRLPRTTDIEIAATVHFTAKDVTKRITRASERDVLDEVKRWKIKRRPPLNDKEIANIIRTLNILGWISLEPSPDIDVGDDVPNESAAYA